MGGWIDGWIHATVLFVYPEGNVVIPLDVFVSSLLPHIPSLLIHVPPLFLLLLNAG